MEATGTRFRHFVRGSGRARPRRARRGPARRRARRPVSGRSSPAATISRVDLPEPDGPTRPTASPLPICRSMSLRICTRAGPRPSERLTPESRIAGAPQSRFRSCGLVLRPSVVPAGHMGSRAAPVQHRGVRRYWLALARRCCPPAAAAERPIRIVVLGDSLSAGFGLAGAGRAAGEARARAQGQGAQRRDRERRRVGRHRGGRACAARLVGAGGNRRGDPRTRRQRCAARHRSESRLAPRSTRSSAA